jgi:hypothetical protein
MAKQEQHPNRNSLANEAIRLAAIKSAAACPDGCGPEIVDCAPARGPVQRFQPRVASITLAGQVRVARAGYNGYDALRRADAFDVMQQQASRRAKADAKPLFTVGQIAAGRDYAALYERCAAAGVRCSSLESLGGGSGQGSYIDAVIRDSGQLAALDRAIGTAVVMSPRGAQAHADRGRRLIRANDLVVGICVGGKTVSQLLQSFGWSRSPTARNKITGELCCALDRMCGFRDQF